MLLDHDSIFDYDVMLCAVSAHRCHGKISDMLPADDPAMRRLGYQCEACGESWDVGLAQIKDRQFNPNLTEFIKTLEGRTKLLKIIRLGGYLMVEDGEYLS